MDRTTVQGHIACALAKYDRPVEATVKRLAELDVDKAENGVVGMVGYRKQKNDGTSTRVAVRVGKFLREQFGPWDNDQQIQEVGAAVTALLWSSGDGDGDDANGVKELEGKALRHFYLASVSGIHSCMAYEDTQEFLNIYVDNPERVKLATVRMNGGAGRALVWTFPDGSRFMDRIYITGDESCRAALANYAKRKGMGSREDIPSDRMPMKIREGEDGRWPYMDTLTYMTILNWNKCELSTSRGTHCLQTTDGYLEEHGYSCCNCGDHLGEDEVCHDADGDDYCEECYNERFFYCDECGNDQDLEDSVVTASGDRICQHCYERHYFTCEDCNEVFKDDEANSVEDGDRTVCNSCYENSFFECEECGEEHHIDHQCHGPDGNEYCEECWEEKFALCEECGKPFAKDTLVDGVCTDCATDKLVAMSMAPAEEGANE